MKFGEEEKITAWKAVESWHLHFVLWRQLMNHCINTNEVQCSKTSWTYLQVLFESLFCLTKLLNIAMVQIF